MSLLLMPLVMLALFVTSSREWPTHMSCFECELKTKPACKIPFNRSEHHDHVSVCTGTGCAMKIWKEDGRFMIYFLFLTDLFTSTQYIDFLVAMVTKPGRLFTNRGRIVVINLRYDRTGVAYDTLYSRNSKHVVSYRGRTVVVNQASLISVYTLNGEMGGCV